MNQQNSYYKLVETEENIFTKGWEWLKATDSLLDRMQLYVDLENVNAGLEGYDAARLEKYSRERANAII